MVNPEDVRKAITPRTILVSVMHANNEVGTIQAIAEIARIARERGVLLHSDAAQSVSKIPTKVEELGVDLLSLAGHKLYAPKGVGALYIRQGLKLEPFMHGATRLAVGRARKTCCSTWRWAQPANLRRWIWNPAARGSRNCGIISTLR
jgi:cysteine sulfinate desulfinase/cysteine desulfurase-like protein